MKVLSTSQFEQGAEVSRILKVVFIGAVVFGYKLTEAFERTPSVVIVTECVVIKQAG